MYKKICACYDIGVAGSVWSLLKANSFNPLELQTSPHVSIAGVDRCYYIEVPEEEYESAKEFLISQGIETM